MREFVPAALLAAAGLAAGQAHAACAYPHAPENVPDGSSATMEQMVAGQKEVKQYMADMEVYLKCLDDEAPPAPPADAQLGEEQKKEAARAEAMRAQKHNAAVSEMETVADHFNRQIKVFKEKQKK